MNPFPLGVGGVFSTCDNLKVEIGPVITANSFGLVFVEIIADAKTKGSFTYRKGESVWLNPSRVTWNEGELP